MISSEQSAIVDDLMLKVGDDVSEAIRRSLQLLEPHLMLPVANRAVMHALGASAMIIDASKGAAEPIPTRASLAFAVFMALHQILDTDDVWGASIADTKKHFPDFEIGDAEVVDRRRKAAA